MTRNASIMLSLIVLIASVIGIAMAANEYFEKTQAIKEYNQALNDYNRALGGQ